MDQQQYTKPRRVRINPSRAKCEMIITRILSTEIQEHGKNTHFRNAMDFMTYFESLYPSGSALTKQVQRAIKAMDLGKDADGFFVLDKTKSQLEDEKELSSILKKTCAKVSSQGSVDLLLLEADAAYKPYLMQLISESETLRPHFLTIVDCLDGLLFLTTEKETLSAELNRLIG